MENDIADREYLKEVARKFKDKKSTIAKSGFIYKIECLSCGKLSAYTKEDDPRKIWCNRRNKCGAEHTHAEHFPGLQSEIYSLHQSKDPIERALAYARNRRGIKTFEEQGGLGVFKKIFGEKVLALQFNLENPGGKESFNFRIINHSNPDNTSCTWGEASSSMWIPKTPLNFDEPIAIAEAPIKAMALNEAGIQAISVVCSKCRPENKGWIDENLKNFVAVYLAFDNDRAGHEASNVWKDFFDEEGIACEVFLPNPEYGDWDDMHKKNELNPEIFQGCVRFAEIALANTALEAAKAMEKYDGEVPPIFEWKSRTYKCKYAKGTIDPPEVETVSQIINGTLKGSHTFYAFEHDDEITSKQYLEFTSPNVRLKPQLFKVTGSELSNERSLERKMYDCVSTPFEGTRKDIAYLMKYVVKIADLPKIYQYDRYGYHPKTGAYIFANFAVDKEGKLHILNDKRFFNNINIAPMPIKIEDSRHITSVEQISLRMVVDHIYNAWGIRGLIALGYYVATYFSSSSIFPILRCFPHLSLHGAPGCGKSMLIGILNRMFQFEAKEGNVLKPTSTAKSINRILASKNALPVVFLEGNDAARIPIDENDLLALYNRESPQTRANRTNDNTINELKYDAGLVMVQNNEWFTQGAVKQRFVSIKFEDKDGVFTSKESLAYNSLQKLEDKCLASCGLTILQNRHHFESRIMGHINRANEVLESSGQVKNERVRLNHSVVLGGLSSLLELTHGGGKIPYIDGAVGFVSNIGEKKVQSGVNTSDIVSQFVSIFEDLAKPSGSVPSQIQAGMHYVIEGDEIWIKLEKTLQVMNSCGHKVPAYADIAKVFRLDVDFIEEVRKRSKKWKYMGDQQRTFNFKLKAFNSLSKSHFKLAE